MSGPVGGPCLGDRLTALVDGELDHAARDQALAHLTGCAGCRAEVEAQRRLKARLGGLEQEPSVPPALTGRLLALAAPGADLGPRTAPGRAVPVAPPTRAGSTRPGGRRPARSSRARRRQAAGALVAVGLGAALALGGPGGGAASTPVDPGADVFVVDHASTTARLPLREPAARVVVLPAR